MDASSKSARMCCYRCSRCQLEVYRHYVHYDRRDRPICDPDCDGTKPGTCIWCEQVIVGRPMLMFEKKVHRECWQYCVAKFGYDEIVRRYTSEDWEQFREREVGEDMVREMVEEFFDKFCTDLVSDDDMPSAEDMTSECLAVWGKKGEQDWGRAIRRVLHNKKHASLPNITCTNEFKSGEEDENQWRGLSEGESIGGGSNRSGNTEQGEEYLEETSLKEMLSESRNDKTKQLHRLHVAEERTEWLQAVQKSVCGDAFFDRESWADEAYRSTLGRNRDRCDVTEDDRRRHRLDERKADNTSSITNTFEGQQNFVDNIIEEAVSVVKECNDDDIYRTTVDGRQVVNYDKVWERSTRKRNNTLMVDASIGEQDRREEVNRHSEFNYVRSVLSTCKTSLVNKLIDEAADNHLESSDEECISGSPTIENLRTCKEGNTEDERVKSVFSKSWEEARTFRAMYEQTTSSTQSKSCTGRGFQRNVDNASSEDTGDRGSAAKSKGDDQNVFDTNSSETAVGCDNIDSKRTSSKRRKRRNKQNVFDGGESGASQPSGHELNSNVDDLLYESASQEKTIDASRIDLFLDNEMSDVADSARRAANIADSGVENILTEEQLDEVFGNALVTSGDPTRLGRLINEFKSAVGDIQHNANTCRECPKSSVTSASENERQSTCSAADRFNTVLTQLMDEVKELKNSILIFRKFARPDHFCETSVNGDLLSSPQGEVYGTGNVLIIFDYGEEALESDPASVYEYLANIYHDRDSPRCFLHRTSNDRFDFSNNSEGNISMYNGSYVTDSASTYREMMSDVSEEATSRFMSPPTTTSMDFESMSTYDEILWAETQRGRSSSLRSLDGSSRLSGDMFCTDAEAQAWAAMLNAGKSEDISLTNSFVEVTKTREDSEENGDNEEKVDSGKRDIHSEPSASKIAHGVSASRGVASKRLCDEGAHSGKSTKRTDAQLLDRLRSIKRINFDGSLTDLQATTTGEHAGAIIVRKSVSEGDVSSYEVCACSTHPSDSSCGGSIAGGVECTTWNEVREIVTKTASTHLQHTVSLGANKGPTDVYQIAVEITINKRTDQNGQKKHAFGGSRSSIDVLNCFQESTSRSDKISDNFQSESEPEKHKTQETVNNEDGDSEKTKSEILNNPEVVCKVSNKIPNSESTRYEVVTRNPTNYLADDSSSRGLSCSESSCKRALCSLPLNEPNTDITGSERESEEILDSCASGKLINIVDTVSNNNLITKESTNALGKISSDHGVCSDQSSKTNILSHRSLTKELYVDGQSDETVHRKHPSEFSIDVDLFSSENITSRGDRKLDHLILDGVSSNEDLFCTGLVFGKCSLKVSKERIDTIGHSSSGHTEETQVGLLKGKDANIFEETSKKNVPTGEGDEDLFGVEDGSSRSRLVDARSSNEVCNSYENIAGRAERKLDHLIFDGASSTEDLFGTDLAYGKCSLKGSKERIHSIGHSSSEHTEDEQVGFLKEENSNIVQGTYEKNAPSGQEDNDLFDIEGGLRGSEAVDPRTSNEVGNCSHEHSVGRRGSEHEGIPRQLSNMDIRVESLVGDGEIAHGKSGARELGFETLATSGKSIESGNSCRQTVVRGTSSDEVNSKMSVSDQTNETAEGNVVDDVSKPCEVRSQVTESPFITFTEEDIFLKLVNEQEILNRASLQSDIKTLTREDVHIKTLVEDDIFLKSSNVPRSVRYSLVPDTDRDSSKHTDDVFDTSLKTDLVLETSEEPQAYLETVIASIDYVETPLIAEVSSKRSNLNILQESRENDVCENTLEYDFENESLVEKELGCMSLCDDDDKFEVHPPNGNESILIFSHRRSEMVSSNGACPKQLETHHGSHLSHREIDNKCPSCLNVLHNTSSTTTGSDLGSYKGNSTEEEQEVCTLLSTSEYGIDHEWSSQCGSDLDIASGDMDGESVLTIIRNEPTSKRVAGVSGDNHIEESLGERLDNAPLAGGEKVTIQAISSTTTKTSLIIDESERESSKDHARDGISIKKKAGIKSRREKNKTALMNENLDEICRLDDNENERLCVSKSTTTEALPPGGKKSKRKRDKKEHKDTGGGRKGSPTCVIL